jgi:hypothetical protein
MVIPSFQFLNFFLFSLKFRLKFLLLLEVLKRTGTTYNFELTDAEKQMNAMEKR